MRFRNWVPKSRSRSQGSPMPPTSTRVGGRSAIRKGGSIISGSSRERTPRRGYARHTLSCGLLQRAAAGVDLPRDDALAGVHVGGAGHAGVEAADGPQDVDALDLVVGDRLKDGGVDDGLLVGAEAAEGVGGGGVEGGRGGDLV